MKILAFFIILVFIMPGLFYSINAQSSNKSANEQPDVTYLGFSNSKYSVNFKLNLNNESQSIQFTLENLSVNSILSLHNVHIILVDIMSINISGNDISEDNPQSLEAIQNLEFSHLSESKNFSYSNIDSGTSEPLIDNLNFSVSGIIVDNIPVRTSFKSSFSFDNVYIKPQAGTDYSFIIYGTITLIAIAIFIAFISKKKKVK